MEVPRKGASVELRVIETQVNGGLRDCSWRKGLRPRVLANVDLEGDDSIDEGQVLQRLKGAAHKQHTRRRGTSQGNSFLDAERVWRGKETQETKA